MGGFAGGVGPFLSLLSWVLQWCDFHRDDMITGFSLSLECKLLILESFGWGTWGSCLSVSSYLLGSLIFQSRCMTLLISERLFMSWFSFYISFLQSTFFLSLQSQSLLFPWLTIFTTYPFLSALAIRIDSAFDIEAQYFLVLLVLCYNLGQNIWQKNWEK